MGNHEKYSTESEWYTPAYIFDAMAVTFDMDVAACPEGLGFVPAINYCRDGLNTVWEGFVWCNPPFAGRGRKMPWIEKMIKHGDGLLLTPDRSSTDWWQWAADHCTCLLMVKGKVKFIPGVGNNSNWRQPGTGTTIFAFGNQGELALITASFNALGIVLRTG